MNLRNVVFAVLLFSCASALLAQNGCVNSPECPSAVLAVVGVAAASVVRRFKRT